MSLTTGARSDRPLLGVSLMVFAMATFSCLDTTAKYLTASLPVVEIVWARYVFHTALLVAALPFLGGRLRLRTRRLRLQVGRSLFLLAATAFFFSSLKYLQLVEASSIAFVSPLVVTVLSVPLLGEHVGPRRWAGVGAGFLGVLVITRPGTGVMHWAAVLPLGMAVCYACYQVATRGLSDTEHTITTLFYTAVVGAAVISCIVPFFWVSPTPGDWLRMGLLGVFGGTGHLLLIQAFRYAEASVLSPFNYVTIITNTLAGYLVFQQLPDAWTFVGAGLVIASGLYVFHRERRLAAV
ncbi:MAG TPA: DMT family transporter [Deferrisomatales bacterium]|nr:DMT family transporter [Deferrisomatales bacterium]